MIASVNRIFFRRSGVRKALPNAVSTFGSSSGVAAFRRADDGC